MRPSGSYGANSADLHGYVIDPISRRIRQVYEEKEFRKTWKEYLQVEMRYRKFTGATLSSSIYLARELTGTKSVDADIHRLRPKNP
jgi:hypothetical protein